MWTVTKKRDYLEFLYHILNTSSEYYFWEYDEGMNLLDTTCPWPSLDELFRISGGYQTATAMLLQSDIPVILWSPFGLIWIIAFDVEDNNTLIRTVGPIMNSNLALPKALNMIRKMDISFSVRAHLDEICDKFPNLSISSIYRIVPMIYYCITGEKIDRQSIRFQGEEQSDKNLATTKDRYNNYMRQQAVLSYIRKGSLNYQQDWDRMVEIGSGSKNPEENDLSSGRISVIQFITLCTTAAIEGGITPDYAYSISNKYIRRCTEATSVGTLKALNRAMYEEFIMAVRDLQSAEPISEPIKACRDYLELNSNQPVSMEDLSTRIGYSKAYLGRKFHAEIGCSISEYLMRCRMEKAKNMLQYSTLDIQEISLELQYCSHTYFATRFKEAYGLSPSEYRRQFQKI